MKQIFVALSAIALVFFSTSCIFSPSIKGNGNVTQEIRNTEDFKEIKVSRGMNVYISQGETTKVIVKADENLLDIIETETLGDVLEISAKSNIRKATVKKIYVTTPNLVSVRSFAGSNIFSETRINSNELEISASAGSNVTLEIKANKTKATASAGSNIILEGITEKLEIKASSGSNIKAKNLSSQNCVAKTSSGANIWITCKKDLTGNASSGGNVFYFGSPENTNIEHSSGGNVIKKTN